MAGRDMRKSALRTAAAVIAVLAPQVALSVGGTVVNGTTGSPQAGVVLTFSSFQGGMTPLEETVSQSDGSFEFSKPLPAVSAGQPFAGAIRAEHDGIGYTEILRGGEAHDSVRVIVYSVSEQELPAPLNRVLILEPSDEELLLRESFQFVNDSNPPVTYSSADGTLNFYLPPEAQGGVDVSGTGPAGMPLRSTALPAGPENIYKVDFPLKPGENRIDLQYAVPYEDGMPFTTRSTYPGVNTRLAAPAGVSLEGVGVASLGQEPTTLASIYTAPEGPAVTLTVSGSGRLLTGAGSGAGGQAEISIEQAPVSKELPWIAGLAIAILGLGFYHLLSSRVPEQSGANVAKRG